MSLKIQLKLCCDKCGVSFYSRETVATGVQLRLQATKKEWAYSGGKDYCPDCRPRRKDGEVWGCKTPKKTSKYIRSNKKKKPAV